MSEPIGETAKRRKDVSPSGTAATAEVQTPLLFQATERQLYAKISAKPLTCFTSHNPHKNRSR